MINLRGSYVAALGYKLATPGSAVRHASDCAIEPTNMVKKRCHVHYQN